MESVEKCIICGEIPFEEAINKNQQNLFSSWKRKCSRSLSDILLGNDSDPLLNYFNIGSYCYFCQQSVREINFTRNLLKTLQNKIVILSGCIRKRLYENYQRLGEKPECSVIEGRLQTLRNENPSFETFSYNEVVEMLYIAAFRFSGELNLLQENIKGDVKIAENFSMNCVKIEPIFQDEINDADENNYFDDGMECPNNYGISPDQIKTEDYQSPNEVCNSNSERSVRSSKRKAALNIRMAVSSDSSENEEKPRKVKKKVAHVPSDELAAKKLREKYDRKNEKRREKRRMDPNYYKRMRCTYENCKVTFMSEERKEIHIRQVHLRSDSSENEGERKKVKKKVSRVPRDELAAKKVREKYDRKNQKRREKRKMDPNHYKRMKCTYENCKITFMSEEKKEIHIRQVHLGEERPFKCSQCPKSFKLNKVLLEHKRTVHSAERSYEHVCKFCGKGYREEEELTTHLAGAHQGPNPFVCAFCDKICTNTSELHRHVSDFHPNYQKPQCDICSKVFPTEKSLKNHKVIHNDPDLQFHCELCGRIFATKHRLKRHLEVHNDINSVVCEVCGKTFKSKAALRSHSDFHSKEKRYKCKICGIGFVKPGCCRKHETTHSGVKEFMCKVCGRAFMFKYNLADHEKIHEREKDPTIVIRKRRQQKTTAPSNELVIASHPSFSTSGPPKNMGPWDPKSLEGYFM